MISTREDWDRLATLFDGTCPHTSDACDWRACQPRTPYAGYKPETREAPNGDTKVCPTCRGAGCGDPAHAGFTGEEAEPVDCLSTCSACHGTGRVPNVDAAGVCGCCDGAGVADPRQTSVIAGGPRRDGLTCAACNGTGRVAGKRYLHVADKYSPPAWAKAYHDRAYAEACRVAEALHVPREFWPMPSVGALRVLEYPAGAGSAEHTDADLFTIVCWRETPEDLERGRTKQDGLDLDGRGLSLGLHIGELGELVGLGPATPHRVPARPYVQRSLVYFCIPSHAAVLPSGQTVGTWLDERMARSRYT